VRQNFPRRIAFHELSQKKHAELFLEVTQNNFSCFGEKKTNTDVFNQSVSFTTQTEHSCQSICAQFFKDFRQITTFWGCTFTSSSYIIAGSCNSHVTKQPARRPKYSRGYHVAQWCCSIVTDSNSFSHLLKFTVKALQIRCRISLQYIVSDVDYKLEALLTNSGCRVTQAT